MQTVQIHEVTYNPASRAFEARVAISDHGDIYTYPCALRAPMDMDIPLASRRLVDMAQRRHARATGPAVSRRPDNVLSTYVPAEIAAATDALWQRLLGRAA